MSIRLLHLSSGSISSYPIDSIRWETVWAISHVWDNQGTHILHGVKGCTWSSAAFSSPGRLLTVLERVSALVSHYKGEYIWMDAVCIDQDSEEDKREQIPHMVKIFRDSAGTIAFGTLTPDDEFSELVHTYDTDTGEKKAWVNNWFERVWTYQELQLPKKLLFLSGKNVFTREEIYYAILIMSPFLSSPHRRLPVQSVLNGLSPKSKVNTQRALQQACSRQSSIDVDKVYDVLDTLTFNTLPVNKGIHDAENWSGMMNLDELAEHPSYETDHYMGENARVIRIGERIFTAVDKAPLWLVTIPDVDAKSQPADAATADQGWKHIGAVTSQLGIRGDFSQVQKGPEYAEAIGRAGRSAGANFPPESDLFVIAAEIRELPSKSGVTRIPHNRLGDVRLFGQPLTVLVCRSKANRLFHYGIVVRQNEDNTWHKVCTASFSDSCVSDRVTEDVVIGG
ncbi:hypothetical protein EDC04DRAFT_2699070 [Pisolithus marmoratus]|nr:hypothetical protein EDC04DRAFT_2699070 [Pisolithus marmoratus]